MGGLVVPCPGVTGTASGFRCRLRLRRLALGYGSLSGLSRGLGLRLHEPLGTLAKALGPHAGGVGVEVFGIADLAEFVLARGNGLLDVDIEVGVLAAVVSGVFDALDVLGAVAVAEAVVEEGVGSLRGEGAGGEEGGGEGRKGCCLMIWLA